jgi:hypothetical protein
MEILDRSTIPSTISLSIEEPQFEHDCTACIFLGRWFGSAHDHQPAEDYDLYACKGTVVARYNNHGAAYLSGTVFRNVNAAIRTAAERAEAFGLSELISERGGMFGGKES